MVAKDGKNWHGALDVSRSSAKHNRKPALGCAPRTPVGPAGAGQVAKAANRIVVGLIIIAVAEGLVFASRAGV